MKKYFDLDELSLSETGKVSVGLKGADDLKDEEIDLINGGMIGIGYEIIGANTSCHNMFWGCGTNETSCTNSTSKCQDSTNNNTCTNATTC